jgi:hypothetical protein
MWTAFLIAFAALAIVGSLLLGWPILVAVVIALVLGGIGASGAAIRAAREKPGVPGGDSRARDISQVRDHTEAGPSETPHATR